MKHHKTLRALFSFQGFSAKQTLLGKFGDPKIRIIELVRRKKKLFVLTVTLFASLTMISHSRQLDTWMFLIEEFI